MDLKHFGPQKGVCDIASKLRKLNAPEKRQLLSILRKLDDCPDGWKNMTPKKQTYILDILHKAIDRLLNPEKVKAASARNNKRNRENGQQKIWNDKKSAKEAQAIREANRQAILANKDHHEATWDEDTLEKKATEIVEMIVDKCGRNGFVHVCGGAWAGKDLNEAAEAECFGRGGNRHAVFIDDSKFVRYRDVSTHVELFTPYTGTNCLNADGLEKRVHTKLIDMGWPQHRRMFVRKGAGSCKGKRAAKIPFPYYMCWYVINQWNKLVFALLPDHAPKRKRQ